MLYPRESESRQIHSLNGFWNFRIDDSAGRDRGFTQMWYNNKLSQVSVSQNVSNCKFWLLHNLKCCITRTPSIIAKCRSMPIWHRSALISILNQCLNFDPYWSALCNDWGSPVLQTGGVIQMPVPSSVIQMPVPSSVIQMPVPSSYISPQSVL